VLRNLLFRWPGKGVALRSRVRLTLDHCLRHLEGSDLRGRRAKLPPSASEIWSKFEIPTALSSGGRAPEAVGDGGERLWRLRALCGCLPSLHLALFA
jgi:hypothetical protein